MNPKIIFVITVVVAMNIFTLNKEYNIREAADKLTAEQVNAHANRLFEAEEKIRLLEMKLETLTLGVGSGFHRQDLINEKILNEK